MDGLIRGVSRWFCSYRWPADWLMVWVLAGDSLMGCPMRLDYSMCLSPSLHASPDSRVSVTPFDPIMPTHSDTKTITFPPTLSSPLVSSYSFCHQQGDFYSLMSSGSVADGLSSPLFCLSSFIRLQGKLRSLQNQTSKHCPQTSLYSWEC